MSSLTVGVEGVAEVKIDVTVGAPLVTVKRPLLPELLLLSEGLVTTTFQVPVTAG